MKAYVLHGINNLTYEDIEISSIPVGWTLVKVMAAGICGSDIPRIFINGTYHFPTIPGHEFSGQVERVGDGVDNKWIGKRVGVFPLIPCGECSCCRDKKYEMCKNYNYLGSRTDGGFAEYALVPQWNLIELPDQVSYEEAAMLEPMSVGIHALKRIPYKDIKSIVIFGMGTIGMLMAQWAKILGIQNIMLICNKIQQVELLKQMDFDMLCDASINDPIQWIMDVTDGEGVDAAVDAVGDNKVLDSCIQSVKAEGDILIVGNPKNDLQLSKDVFWKIHRKQLNLHGTWNSSYTGEIDDDWHNTVNALKNGNMRAEKLITHLLPWDQLDKGLDIMRDKKQYSCKVMISKNIHKG